MRKTELNLIQSQTIFIGIDVHKNTWHVTIQDYDIVYWSGSIVGNWKILEKLIEPLKGKTVFSCYEAGFSGFDLHDQLVKWGSKNLVVNPAQIPKMSNNKVKTDRIDSYKLALCLAKGLLKSIYIPTLEEREHRELVRCRKQIMNERIRLMNQIKSKFYYFGISIPEKNGSWTKEFIQKIRSLVPNQEIYQMSFSMLFEIFELTNQQLKNINKKLKTISNTKKYKKNFKILTSAPGIGTLIAMELLLEIPNIKSFKNGKYLAAYVGLTPSQYSSGDHVRMGRITRTGKPHLRSMLIEASWTLIRKDNSFRKFYDKLKHRSGGKRAIVAVARKLMLILRSMLINQKEFEYKEIELQPV
jgi:transposase